MVSIVTFFGLCGAVLVWVPSGISSLFFFFWPQPPVRVLQSREVRGTCT